LESTTIIIKAFSVNTVKKLYVALLYFLFHTEFNVEGDIHTRSLTSSLEEVVQFEITKGQCNILSVNSK